MENASSMSAEQFKQSLKLLYKERKSRGPTGAKKVAVNLPGLEDIITSIKDLAANNGSNAVEVVDAVLRAEKLGYQVVPKPKAEDNTTAAEVTPDNLTGNGG